MCNMTVGKASFKNHCGIRQLKMLTYETDVVFDKTFHVLCFYFHCNGFLNAHLTWCDTLYPLFSSILSRKSTSILFSEFLSSVYPSLPNVILSHSIGMICLTILFTYSFFLRCLPLNLPAGTILYFETPDNSAFWDYRWTWQRPKQCENIDQHIHTITPFCTDRVFTQKQKSFLFYFFL